MSGEVEVISVGIIPTSAIEFDTLISNIESSNDAGISYPEEEEKIVYYVGSAYDRAFGASENFGELDEGQFMSSDAREVGNRVVVALKGEASWNGIVMDVLGIIGLEDSHALIAENFHKGILKDVATPRLVASFLVGIGVPIGTVIDVFKTEGLQQYI